MDAQQDWIDHLLSANDTHLQRVERTCNESVAEIARSRSIARVRPSLVVSSSRSAEGQHPNRARLHVR